MDKYTHHHANIYLQVAGMDLKTNEWMDRSGEGQGER